ncbi:MAG: ABC transporter permease [Spirochaetes bacterium]|nr:ABC transporter permease [Spirochaetota bacterium]
MCNILKADFFKLKKSGVFRACIALCVLAGFFVVAAMHADMSNAGSRPEATGQTLETVSAAQAAATAMSFSFHIIFIAMFVSVFSASEFASGTVKNTLSRGANRGGVFLSKFIAGSVASLAITLAFASAIIALGTALWGHNAAASPSPGAFALMLFLQGFLAIAFCALFTFTSMTLRVAGGAIAANVISVTMFSTVLAAIGLMTGGEFNLGNLWLAAVVQYFAVFDFGGVSISRGLAIAGVWTASSLAAGICLFARRDVK